MFREIRLLSHKLVQFLVRRKQQNYCIGGTVALRSVNPNILRRATDLQLHVDQDPLCAERPDVRMWRKVYETLVGGCWA